MEEKLVPKWQDHHLDVLMATPLHQHIGLHEADPSDPAQGLIMTVDPQTANNSGMLHGGLVATALDVAAAHSVFPMLTEDEVVLTSSLSISYLRPVPIGSTMWARGEVLRRGRATAFIRSQTGIGDKIVATGQIVKTIMKLEDKGP